MNKMIGIVMMILGILLLASGYLVYSNHQKLVAKKQTSAMVSSESMSSLIQAVTADGVLTNKEKNMVEQSAIKYDVDPKAAFAQIDEILSSADNEAETEIVDQEKKKGDDFEKFIIKKFNKKFFTIKQWAGDKYVEGIFSEKTQQPDIIVEFNLGNYSKKVAIECKYRSSIFKGSVQFSYDDQLKRYKEFEQKEHTDVYIALGIGGKASNPEALYLIPLKSQDEPFITKHDLVKYKKETWANFYLDRHTGTLDISTKK